MKTTTWILAAAFLPIGLPVAAEAPGHYSASYDHAIMRFDFKNGVGIADPNDQDNPCTILLLGFSLDLTSPAHYHSDLRIGTNLNGPIAAIGNQSPPLVPVPWFSWLHGSAGIPLGFSCPIPGSPGDLWLIWSGMNWHSSEDAMLTEINLCGQTGTACFPVIGSQVVHASTCPWAAATFTANYNDAKGKVVSGFPFDPPHMKSDAIACAGGITHSHDYSNTITTFDLNYASQDVDLIKNEALVHSGTGTAYVIVCWSIDYIDIDSAPFSVQTARTHDWKLIVDLVDSPPNIAAAVMNHVGPFNMANFPAPGGGGGPGTFALKGLYSLSPTAAGQNGFGPCPTATVPTPEAKKPQPADQSGTSVRCIASRHANTNPANDLVTAACSPGTGAECEITPIIGGGSAFGPIFVKFPPTPYRKVVCTSGTCTSGGRVLASAELARGNGQVETKTFCSSSTPASALDAIADGPPAHSVGTMSSGAFRCEITFDWDNVNVYSGLGSCQMF